MKTILILTLLFTASAHAVDYTYDALGRLRAESFANNAHILHTYDALGNRTERRVIPPNATPSADLLTTVTLTPDPAAQGLPLTATITVQNLGPDPAADVLLNSALPAALVPQSATATQGSAALSGQNLVASLGTIPAGETVTLTVFGTASGTANFLVEATATAPADSTPGNNTGSDNTTPAASANLALLRLHSGPQPLLSSGTAILAFTARNDGPATATGVEAEVVLPPQLTHVNSIGGTGFSVNGSTVTVTLADLAPDTETTIFVLATPGGSGDFTTTVTLLANEADPDAANNTDSVVSNVLAPTITVTNANDSGAGSLRQAILDANAAPDEDRIAFAIPGGVVPTIAPTTPLPAITQPVLIDGWSQPERMVEINGSGQGANTDVLTVQGSDVTLRALCINRGPRDGILVSSGDNANRSENIALFACHLGVDPTGTIDLGNTGDGVQVTFANRVTIGGPETWQSCVISGNGADGINVTSGTGHIIQNNRIGCDVNGTVAIFNASEGINFSGQNSLIGGTGFGEGNLVSGNRAEGVQLDGFRNRMFGNLVGTDITGTAPLPNGTGVTANSQAGVAAGGSQNQIGGPEAAQRNIISGNNVTNVRMQNQCLVIGNYIGLDITGTQAVGGVDPNAVGVRFNFSDANSPCVLGGFLPGHGNVVSGNNSHGINWNIGNARGSLVVGNLIGTTADGKTARPNGGHGIFCNSTLADGNHSIGGTLAGAGNLISGNTGSGIRFQNNGGTAARTYTIQANRIGVDIDGDPLANGAHGIELVSAQDNLVGGTTAGAGNVIAHNTGNGVSVTTAIALGSAPALRNRILGNSIHSNGGLGIDLNDDGITANDALDADTGPNNLQNFPVVTLAESGSSGLTGTLQTAPSQTVRVEFFTSAAADASGHGEGETFLGHANVVTDTNGGGTFVVFFNAALQDGALVTSTATDADGNTSEFGAAVAVVAGDTIADTEPPVIVSAPTVLNLTAGAGGTAALPDLTDQVVATDNKAVASITQDPVAGTALAPGMHTVTLSVKDAADNEDTATVAVNVSAQDTEAPVITSAPTVASLPASVGGTAALPDFTGQVVATDNVGIAGITQNPPAGTLLAIGQHNVVLTVRDAANNFDTATVQVTVFDPDLIVATTLFASQGQVPGEPAGTVFTKFGPPMLDGDDVGFLASILPAGARKAISAIFGGSPAAVQARVGEVAPDADGAEFSKLSDPVFAGGSVSFTGTIAGGTPKATRSSDTGIWSDFNGALALIAREGADAPGAGGAKFSAFTALSASADSIVFTATLRSGGGVTKANNAGLWRHRAGATELLVRTGSMFDVGGGDLRTVKSIRALPATVPLSPDQARSHGGAGEFRALLGFTDKSSAACVFPIGAAAFTEVLTGDAPLDIAGAAFRTIGAPASGTDGAAFLGTLAVDGTTVSKANDSAVFLGDVNGFNSVAREGGVAPDADGATFAKLSDPILAGADAVTFVGTLKKGTGTPKAAAANDTGLWSTAGGTLRMVVREGGAAPGVSDTGGDGAFSRFIAFQSAPLDAALKTTIFLATLRNKAGGVTKQSNQGLWAASPDGSVRLIARTGTAVTVDGADLPVRSIAALRTVRGTPGAGRGTSTTGRVVYLAGFAGGAQAVVQVELPQ